jgi:hypothetical protein
VVYAFFCGIPVFLQPAFEFLISGEGGYCSSLNAFLVRLGGSR